uniref:Nucleoside 2-deoxyribosyltransferase n=1 Tax=Siphoviridae sp. ctzm5103 TaxID=2825750 RepID=A0A8S5TT92_9CAUD|nr:MAG TPA: Nucleoside 2-deoxyribosyltransferase [Siphoviridae sp. ctzm5103]
MKKIYISGKITNNANYKADFEAAELALKIAGFQPVNPAEEHLPDGATWADYMRHDIKLLCDCDAIYMLNGWRESAGAKIEHKLARDLGIEIIYEIKKPVYNTEYRHAQYMKNREEINRKARARYRAKCGIKAIKEAE